MVGPLAWTNVYLAKVIINWLTELSLLIKLSEEQGILRSRTPPFRRIGKALFTSQFMSLNLKNTVISQLFSYSSSLTNSVLSVLQVLSLTAVLSSRQMRRVLCFSLNIERLQNRFDCFGTLCFVRWKRKIYCNGFLRFLTWPLVYLCFSSCESFKYNRMQSVVCQFI